LAPWLGLPGCLLSIRSCLLPAPAVSQPLWACLQAEEAQQQQPSDRQQQVLGILRQNEVKALSVEDEQLFARARSLMPLEVWRQSARQHVELNRLLEPGSNTASVNDLVVKSMLQWFKQDFFTWVRLVKGLLRNASHYCWC